MKKPIILATAVLAILTTIPLSCSPQGTEKVEVAELRTYTVPQGFENEIRSMLRSALGTEESRIGRVSVGPGGKLVVVAPAPIHRGIRQLIDELGDVENAPPPKPVTLTYWMVAGRPGSGATGSYEVVGPRALDEVRSALEGIAASQGAMEFELIERLELVSIGEDTASISGRQTGIDQRAAVVDGSVIADVKIQMRRYGVHSEVKLERGQFVVLGNTGYDGGFNGEPTGETEVALYFIITSDLPS